MFGSPEGKNVVVSDTTIARVLNWVDPRQFAASLLEPCRLSDDKGLLQRRLSPKGPSRRIGVYDGSQMGQHYLVAALLCGKINYPALVEPCVGRGNELKTAKCCLPLLAQKLGRCAPYAVPLRCPVLHRVNLQNRALNERPPSAEVQPVSE